MEGAAKRTTNEGTEHENGTRMEHEWNMNGT